jgi:hypothetical protein
MKYWQKMLFAALIFVLAIFASCGEKGKESASNKAIPPASGYTVTVTEEAQRIDGITTVALKQILYRERVAAYGKVLSPDGLNSSRNSYVAALAGLEKTEAKVRASEKEHERMKALNASGKNVSDRALQAAEAQLAADKADEALARGALLSARDAIRLQWGPILSGWIFDYSVPLRGLLGAEDVLVQITVPPAVRLQGIPKEVRIEPPAGSAMSASFVSRATTTDPRIQGMSFIYIASSRSGSLVPGMNVMAHMPSVRTQDGFIVPDSAVVWLQDRSWVYVKKSKTGFLRVEVPISTPVNSDYFVSDVFSPGDQIVIKGAQALLSEEGAPKATGGGGGEEEDED